MVVVICESDEDISDGGSNQTIVLLSRACGSAAMW